MAGLLVLFSGSVDAQYNSRTGRQSGKTVPKILGQMKIQVRSLYSQRAGLARVVQGTIEQSTTWREGSYIRIQGEVTVGRDATLTILPGTRVDFDEEAVSMLKANLSLAVPHGVRFFSPARVVINFGNGLSSRIPARQ